MKKLVNSIIILLIFLIILGDILRESEPLERKINRQLRKWDRTKTIAFLRLYFHRFTTLELFRSKEIWRNVS